VAAKRKQIDDLRKRVLAGEDFAALAKQFSEDPGSKENGGELPEFPRGQMVPEFESAAFALSTNQVSEVITTQFGYHIIKLLDKTPAKKVDYATAATDIKDGLARMKISKLAPDYVKKLRTDDQVEILDANLKALDEKVQANQAAAAAEAPATGTSK
jgi:parvulin-like peptidyl-prolyl isomerase